MTTVYGATVDDETRCIHYRTATDIIAIRFACCDRYYPCHLCHAEAETHEARQWALAERETKAVHAMARILLHGSDPLPLGERAVSVLLLLVEQAGRLVRKDHLIDSAWNGMAVEESNLTVQIAALRRVLAAVPGGRDWIETLPRRGYVGSNESIKPNRKALASIPNVALVPVDLMTLE